MVKARRQSLSDYAWHQGLAHWVPLSRIFSGNLSSVPPPFPPSPSVAITMSWRRKVEAIFEIIFGDVTGEITMVAGVERIQGLSGRDFLSNVFKRRKDDEMEELFITGTKSATPLLQDIDTRWPKPWVFSKAIIASLAVFGGFYFGSVQLHNLNMVPGAILVGSFAIPSSILIFFIEMNVARNFSVYQTLRLVFMGGLVALIIAIFLSNVFPAQTNSEGAPTWGGAAVTGVIEEAAKVLAAIFFMGKGRFNWSLNGLLIGAAIGTGFSAFESAGYALQSMLVLFKQMIADRNDAEWSLVMAGMTHSIELRALLAPFQHVIWTALATAALWKVKGDHPFRWAMLRDTRFLRVFVMVALFHAIWDSPWIVPYVGPVAGTLLKEILIGLIGWVAVFGYIQDGLQQIRNAQSSLPPLPLTPSSTGVSQVSPA
jgi:RsiW-degrading membrane proteinase PrsW (M82 family)